MTAQPVLAVILVLLAVISFGIAAARAPFKYDMVAVGLGLLALGYLLSFRWPPG
jgi:hypothetical protein